MPAKANAYPIALDQDDVVAIQAAISWAHLREFSHHGIELLGSDDESRTITVIVHAGVHTGEGAKPKDFEIKVNVGEDWVQDEAGIHKFSRFGGPAGPLVKLEMDSW